VKSIKTKLIMSYSILVLSVTLIIGFISLEIGYSSLKKEAENSLGLLAGESAKLVENRLEALTETLNMIAMKNEIINMGWEVDAAIIKEELRKTGFIDIGFVLPNGYTYYTDGTVRLMSDRAYVKEALGGKAKISDVIISRVTRKPEIEVAVPVLKEGEAAGALVGRMEADSLSDITKDISYGEQGYSFIINETGTIIAHPDTDMVVNRYNPVEEAEDNPDLKPMSKALQKILQDRAGVADYGYDGRNFYAGFAPIDETGWSFVIAADQVEIMSAIPRMVRSIIMTMLIILLCSLVVAYLFDNSLTKPLIEMTKHSKRIGNLDIRENIAQGYLKQKDEIGTLSGAFQKLTENLREIIKELANSANQVTDTAQELSVTSQQSAQVSEDIAHTVEDIAKGAYEQASNTESGLTQAALLKQKIDVNHQHMVNLNSTTEQVIRLVGEGLTDINRLSTITQENEMATKKICDVILQVKTSSEQIGNASGIISDMARQTNLLALNAAIEAARAGEAGRGFAVVAEEVQRMADQSANATRYIDNIIKELQKNILNAVDSMNHISYTSGEQHKSVSVTIQKYQNISEAMKKSELAVEELNLSEKEMETANNEIKTMLQSLSSIAEQNAASTQQTVSAMEEQTASVQVIADVIDRLTQLAGNLRATVTRFQV
jgi:methyl-accepting chemotaxis protein